VNLTRIPDKLLQPEVIAPLFVPPAFFVTVLVSIAVVLWFRARSERARHEMAMLFMEKGQPVPPELLGRPRLPASDLRRGMVLLAMGAGLGLALLVAGQPASAGVGLVPALTGLGYLAVWRIEGKNRNAG
jgi:hypothetical protein